MTTSSYRSIPTRRTPLAPLGLALAAALAFVAAPAASAQFCEEDGLVVVEVESAPLAGAWVAETDVNAFTGECFYRWDGPDNFNSPGSGVLTYTIEITQPGDYQMRYRNHHDHPDATLENDAWTRMDGGTWTKTYSKFNNTWTWSTRFEHSHDDKEDAHYVLSAGTHTFQISGRSHDFRIDRIHFYLNGTSGSTDAGQSETPCSTWNDLGQAMAGSDGTPLHTGEGLAVAPSLLSLRLENAPPGAQALLIVGFSQFNASFKGGTLVPALDLVMPVTTNAAGEHWLSFSWSESIAPGTSMYSQYWIADRPAPNGVAASNAVSITAP